MPNSLKCKIKHLCHNRTITERERDRILKALEQEDILNKIIAEIDELSRHFYSLNPQYLLDMIDKYKAGSEE